MAFREIHDHEVGVDAPITNELLTAIRDNLEAIRTGDATAPTTTVSSSSSVIGVDALKRGTPSAGIHTIWSQTSYQDSDDTSLFQINIHTTGEYRIRMLARCGTSESGGDNRPPTSSYNLILKRERGGTITTLRTDNALSQQSELNADSPNGNEIRYDVDLDLEAGDDLIVEFDEINFAQGSVTILIGVSDPEAMYGVDVRGTLT